MITNRRSFLNIRMKKVVYPAMYFFLCLMFGSCNDEQTRQRSLNGWDLTADLQNEMISISHDSLGTVMDAIQLQIISEGVKTKLTDWKVKSLKDGLIISTNNPFKSSWEFKLLENRIVVSSLAGGSFITAMHRHL